MIMHESNTKSQSLIQKKCIIDRNITVLERVQLARHPNRPHVSDYIERIFTDYIELHGDRKYADDRAIIGGFAKIDNYMVMIIGTQKGKNIEENLHRNFGCPKPEGYRKALRLMKIAQKAKVPILTIIDTPGAYPGISSEERHIGEAIAVNIKEMFNLSVPIVSIIIGEGGSGGAMGIGVADRILMLENSYYSVITPEGCSAILWPDNSNGVIQSTLLLKITAKELYKFNIIDTIISEPLGGAHMNYEEISTNLKNILIKELKILNKYNIIKIKQDRYNKYRNIGEFIEK